METAFPEDWVMAVTRQELAALGSRRTAMTRSRSRVRLSCRRHHHL